MKRFAIIFAAIFLVVAVSVTAEAAQQILIVKEPARWHQKSEVEKFPAEVLRLSKFGTS